MPCQHDLRELRAALRSLQAGGGELKDENGIVIAGEVAKPVRRSELLVGKYLGDESSSYEAGQHELAAARLLHYVNNPIAREAKSRELMARAEQFTSQKMVEKAGGRYLMAIGTSMT